MEPNGNGELTKYRITQLEEVVAELRQEHKDSSKEILANIYELKVTMLTGYATKKDLDDVEGRVEELEKKESGFIGQVARYAGIAIVSAIAGLFGGKVSP